ncbi:hypothetical protein [Paenibacillus cremeus]|nr:hypothetical protein [Paenibacillus cremeus]
MFVFTNKERTLIINKWNYEEAVKEVLENYDPKFFEKDAKVAQV